MQIRIDDIMRLGRRVRQPARQLLVIRAFRFIGEKLRLFISRLNLRLRKIDAVLVNPRRRACFEPHQFKAQLL
ncbi:hypothetical protein D1872_237570 [compost metagenome]